MLHLGYGSTSEASKMLPTLSLLLPIPFSFCRTMGVTTGTAQARMVAKEIQELRNNFQ